MERDGDYNPGIDGSHNAVLFSSTQTTSSSPAYGHHSLELTFVLGGGRRRLPTRPQLETI